MLKMKRYSSALLALSKLRAFNAGASAPAHVNNTRRICVHTASTTAVTAHVNNKGASAYTATCPSGQQQHPLHLHSQPQQLQQQSTWTTQAASAYTASEITARAHVNNKYKICSHSTYSHSKNIPCSSFLPDLNYFRLKLLFAWSHLLKVFNSSSILVSRFTRWVLWETTVTKLFLFWRLWLPQF